MIVYKSKYLILDYFEESSHIEIIWLPATELLTDEKFKKESKKYVEKVEEYLPKKTLMDNQNMKFVIIPTIQQWLDENVTKKTLQAGIEKVAFVESKNIFAQIAIEQIMSERQGLKKEVKYFDCKEKAIQWLLT